MFQVCEVGHICCFTEKSNYINENNNYIFESTIKGTGRGLFAGKDYKKGDMIDINPFIEIIPRGNINSYSWSCPWNNLYLFGSFRK